MIQQNNPVLITGATSGIGLELLHLYHALGHLVIAHGRSETRLSKLCDQFSGVHSIKADLGDADAVDAMMAQVMADFPDLSLVINNAAIQNDGRMTDAEFSASSAKKEIAINFLAPVLICRAVITHQIAKRRGRVRIVNVSSGLAFFPKTSSAFYCASKAALHSFSQSLRYQLASADAAVAISEVFLPVVDTPMTSARNVRKMSAKQAAMAIHDGIEAGQDEIYVGKARWIPLISRISPALMKSILRNG